MHAICGVCVCVLRTAELEEMRVVSGLKDDEILRLSKENSKLQGLSESMCLFVCVL